MTPKYQRWYDQIIIRARSRRPLSQYCEVHHIIPRSLGGSDDPKNLVELTYREHFLVHWLLTKIHRGKALRSMACALQFMRASTGQRIVAAWQYEVAKRVTLRVWRKKPKKPNLATRLAAIAASKNEIAGLHPVIDRKKIRDVTNDWLADYGAIRRSQKGKPVVLVKFAPAYQPRSRKKATSKIAQIG